MCDKNKAIHYNVESDMALKPDKKRVYNHSIVGRGYKLQNKVMGANSELSGYAISLSE